jgi:hypothetical protein
METFVLPHSGKEVRLPATGAEWELYTVARGPCARAARSLTTALKKACVVIDKAAKDGFRPNEKGLSELYEKHLVPVMSKYADLGAYDTETRSHAYAAMERVVEVVVAR